MSYIVIKNFPEGNLHILCGEEGKQITFGSWEDAKRAGNNLQNPFIFDMKNGLAGYNNYTRTVSWSIDAFEIQAEDLVGENWRDIYDENKFEIALDLMIDKHDTMLGISWDTVTCNLEEHCKF